MLRRCSVVALSALAALPAAALAKPHEVLRTSRVDFGPTFAGNKVVVAAAPRVLLVTTGGRVRTLSGVDSPVVAQRAQAHAATPEGSLTIAGGPLAVALNRIAWQTTEDHVDPSGDRQHYVNAYVRLGLPRGTDHILGAFTGFGGSSGPIAECTAPSGFSVRSFPAIALSTEWLAYVTEEPPRECPEAQSGSTLKLIARNLGVWPPGPERVLAEAPLPALGAPFPFTDLRVRRGFVAWLSPSSDGTYTATIEDQWYPESVPYHLVGLSPTGFAMDEGGTVAVATPDGAAAWASPDQPSLHPLGPGRPWAVVAGRALLQDGRSLVLATLADGTRQTIMTLRAGERFVGTADFNNAYAMWAVRHKVCRRKHRHRRCKRVDSVMVAPV